MNNNKKNKIIIDRTIRQNGNLVRDYGFIKENGKIIGKFDNRHNVK